MSRTYWRVSPAFWTDDKVVGWGDDAKLLALYLLTCDHRTAEGLFRLPKGYICEDLGWTMERLGEPFRELLRNGFIEYDDEARVCFLVNALEYGGPENPNQIHFAIRALEDLPRTRLFARLFCQAERFNKPFAEALRQALPERLGEPIGEPPTPTPTPTPKITYGAPPSSDTPKKTSGQKDAEFRDLEEPKQIPDGRTEAQKLVAFYVDERKRIGSRPTKTQIGILAAIVGDKLQGGSKPELVTEAIRRMVVKGKPPSTLAAFIDEVEAEKWRPPAHPSHVPFEQEPDLGPEERAASLAAMREAAERVKRLVADIGKAVP